MRFGQLSTAFANTVRRFVVPFPGDDRVRQIADGGLKLLVRDSVILRYDGGLAPSERGFAFRYASLSPLHFAVGNAVGVLCKGGHRHEEERHPHGGDSVVGRFCETPRRLTQTPYKAVHCNRYYVL